MASSAQCERELLTIPPFVRADWLRLCSTHGLPLDQWYGVVLHRLLCDFPTDAGCGSWRAGSVLKVESGALFEYALFRF